MTQCHSIRAQFSEYLDGTLTGVAMQKVAGHTEHCAECQQEFSRWRMTQRALADLGPAKPPAELALRLRVAISQEHARTPRHLLDMCKVRWQNTVQPYLLQASAGFASAVLLVGTMALLIGAFAAPESADARDEAIGTPQSPHLLYTTEDGSNDGIIGQRGNPLVVEAYVDGNGRVYDYHIVSGVEDEITRGQLENLLLFSVFQPALRYGQPVRGVAVLSFSGVSVQG